jgi:hypothetical protein
MIALLAVFALGLAAVGAMLLFWPSRAAAPTETTVQPEETPNSVDAPQPPPKQRTRHEFVAALAKVEEGMPEDQVLGLLGKPDDIQTQRDPGGISTFRTREIWCYGTNGHLTFPTLGSICIDRDGKAQYIFGGRGEPPDPRLLPEEQLRSLLRLIDGVPSYNAGWSYDPLPVIRVVNALQPLGKEKALAALAEYLRVASHYTGSGREGVFLVLRVLFDVPADPGHMPDMHVGAPDPPGPKDPKRLPHFPLLLLDDVPLLLVSGYVIGGFPEQSGTHLHYFREKGHLREKPLTPGNKPLALLDRFVKSAGWLYGDDLASAKMLVANQILRLIDSVYRLQVDVDGLRLSDAEALDARWASIGAEVAKLDIRWNPATQRYTFKDGSRLPERVRKRYQRILWKLDGLPGEAELILERQDERHVRVILHWSGDQKSKIPLAVVKVFATGDGGNALAALRLSSIAWTDGDLAFSSQSWMVELAERDEVQVKLEIGKDEKLSPKYRP